MDIFRAMSSPDHPFEEEWARQAAETAADRGGVDQRATQRQVSAGRTAGNALVDEIQAITKR